MKIMKIAIFLSIASAFSCQTKIDDKRASEIIERFERTDAPILKGFYLPEDAVVFQTSGLVAPVIDAEGNDLQKYGDMATQCHGVIKRIKETLALKDFTIRDIVFLRVYIAPDQNGHIDFDTFFSIYGTYFNNADNPNKVARSTIGVYRLARPGLLIEVEALAARVSE